MHTRPPTDQINICIYVIIYIRHRENDLLRRRRTGAALGRRGGGPGHLPAFFHGHIETVNATSKHVRVVVEIKRCRRNEYRMKSATTIGLVAKGEKITFFRQTFRRYSNVYFNNDNKIVLHKLQLQIYKFYFIIIDDRSSLYNSIIIILHIFLTHIYSLNVLNITGR